MKRFLQSKKWHKVLLILWVVTLMIWPLIVLLGSLLIPGNKNVDNFLGISEANGFGLTIFVVILPVTVFITVLSLILASTNKTLLTILGVFAALFAAFLSYFVAAFGGLFVLSPIMESLVL